MLDDLLYEKTARHRLCQGASKNTLKKISTFTLTNPAKPCLPHQRAFVIELPTPRNTT